MRFAQCQVVLVAIVLIACLRRLKSEIENTAFRVLYPRQFQVSMRFAVSTSAIIFTQFTFRWHLRSISEKEVTCSRWLKS